MTIKHVIALDPALLSLLQGALQGTLPISRVESKIDKISETIGAIRMKLEDFQAKIDTINANTTASAAAATAAAASAGNAAAAAQTIKATLDALRGQISNAGLDATQEAALFASLDSAAAGTELVKNASAATQATNEALASFLAATAAGPTEPTPVPVPEPVAEPTPEPTPVLEQ